MYSPTRSIGRTIQQQAQPIADSYRKQLEEQKPQDWRQASNVANGFYRSQANANPMLMREAQKGINEQNQKFGYDFKTGNYDDYLNFRKFTGQISDPSKMSDGQKANWAKDYQQRVASRRATDFSQNLPQYIEGETSGLRDALSEKMGQQRKNLLAEYNRRGLLKSGQMGMAQTNLASDFAGQFEQGRADIYKKAQDEAQRLFTDPTLKGLGYDARAMDVQSQLDQMKSAQDSARSQLFGGAMGLIGQGLGGYLGNRDPNMIKKSGVNTGAPAGGVSASPFR